MVGAIIIIITIIACVFGYCANSYYQNKYTIPAVDVGMLIIQCIFMVLAMLTLPNPDVTFWFVLWVVLLIGSYIVAIFVCKQQCSNVGATRNDTILAILAQTVIPLGVALFIIILIALVLSSTGGGKKKKK